MPENLYEGFHDKLNDFIEKDLKKAEDKILDIGKKSSAVFDDLYSKSDKNNPFVSFFSETDKAAKDLRENLKGLAPELRDIAEQMQQKLNADSLFNTRLDNDFAAFDLRQRADELRSFKAKPIDAPDKFFKDFIEAGLKQILEVNGGAAQNRYSLTGAGNSTFGFSQSKADPYTRYNLTGAGDSTYGFSQSDLRTGFLGDYERTETSRQGILVGSFRRDRKISDLTDQEKSDFIDKDNLSLQSNLSKAFSLAQNRDALSPEQQAAVDREILSLSANVKPEQLNDYQRNLVATAAEKEATRRDNYERAAATSNRNREAYLKNISQYCDKLRNEAQTGGSASVNITIKDETNGGASVGLSPAPNAKKTADYYRDYQNALDTLDFER